MRPGHTVLGLYLAGLLVGLAPGLALAQAGAGAPPAPVVPGRTSEARAAAADRARRAAEARLQAAAQRGALPEGFRGDDLGAAAPKVRAAAAIVYDPDTSSVLWEANSHVQRPIASLTKIMTAVTFIADDPDLSVLVSVTQTDVRRASVTYLRRGDVLSYSDLLHLTLIASDNAAARVLARTSEGGTAAFVARMNEMAVDLGLTSSRFADPSGLNSRNVSSAYDLSQLIAFADGDQRLGPVMRTARYEAKTTRRTIRVRSTNRLLGIEVDIVAGKTGFIRRAGYCLAALFRAPEGSRLAVVVLGATNSRLRFSEARDLFNWAASRMQGLLAVAGPLVQD